jgi:hypothetical protein
MPIQYHVNHDKRLVVARAHGTLSDHDVFAYQTEVWSLPDLAGYDELVDMTDVTQIVQPSTNRVRQLASVSAGMDAVAPQSKFAIVAPSDLAFGLGRMYAAHRSLDSRSTKQVEVFRTLDEALAFLGIDRAAVFPGRSCL